VAAHLGLMMSVAEQTTCKFNRDLRGTDSNYEDAIYKGQKIYDLDNDCSQLVVYNGTSVQTIVPPAVHWKPGGNRREVEEDYWKASVKRPIKSKKNMKRKSTEWSSEKIKKEEEGMPTYTDLAWVSDNVPLPLSMQALIGSAITNGGPLPWKCIVAEQKVDENGPFFKFRLEDANDKPVDTPMCNIRFEEATECKIDGVLRFVAENNRKLLAKTVFRLLDCDDAKRQLQKRILGSHDPTSRAKRSAPEASIRSGYYLLHTYPKNSKHARRIAVVKSISRDAVLLCIYNRNYFQKDAEKDTYLLRRETQFKK